MNQPTIITRTAEIRFSQDYTPSILSVPVSVHITGESDASTGNSQLSVLIDALDSFKATVERRNYGTEEKQDILDLVWELETALMGRLLERLSQATGVLHDIRFDTFRTRNARREPLT